jgi:hypothetical protein
VADTKVSGLSAVAAFATALEFPVNDAGTSKKITGAQIIAALPQGTLPSGYAEVTANQGTFTALTDLTSLTVTVTIAAGRRIRVSALAAFSSSVSGDVAQFYIREGATSLQIVNVACATSAGFYAVASVILTPSAAAHTYKLSAQRQGGTGNITMNAAAATPAYILVEDIGV